MAIVVLLVLVAAAGYRFYGDPETGTGTLTLPQPAPNVGQRAPEFRTEGAYGETFGVSDRGVKVLTFWSALNRGSDQSRAQFEQLSREYGDEEISFAAVYVSSIPEEEEDAPYVVLRDSSGRLSGLYNVKRVPRLFLISDGRIMLVQNGFYAENEEQLRAALDEVLQARNPRSD